VQKINSYYVPWLSNSKTEMQLIAAKLSTKHYDKHGIIHHNDKYSNDLSQKSKCNISLANVL